ncbi:MAG: multidrug effflux MFS transporter [Marinibacterium sp.]|nr:multidrug effflux MFS transporter [Marinibacterium sp.]
MFRPSNTPPHLTTLILLTAVSVLSLNMFLPSLAHIARDFESSYLLASISISGYLAVTAVLQIILGPVADRYGRRPVLLGCLVLFVLASICAALAQSIWIFLAARLVQAGIIAGSALASAIISDTADRSHAASLMGYVGMAMAVAPMLAPMLGGALDQFFGWRSGFWLYAGLGGALLWLTWVDLGETNPAPADTFTAQLRAYPELFRSRRFWGYSICAAFGVGAFYLFVSSTPLVAVEVFHLSPTIVGLGIGSITGGFFVGSFLSGQYSERMGPLRMIFAGRIVAFVGVLIALLVLLLWDSHPVVYFAGGIAAGLGNGLTVPNARAGALAIRPHLAGSASGLSGALIVAGGAVLTPLPGLLLTPENGAWLALVLMLSAALGGLAAALYVWAVDRQEARVALSPRA